MAARLKKKLNQDDLRKLMKERRDLKSSERKINSPYAKYNSIGQLLCSLCNLHIKNETLWASHILSKVHKQSIESVNKKESSLYKPEPVHCNNGKRKADCPLPEAKQLCISRPDDSNNENQDPSERVNLASSSSVNKLSMLQGYSSSDDDGDSEEGYEAGVSSSVGTSVQNEVSSGVLPPDFFDADPTEASVLSVPSERNIPNESSLPCKEVEKENSASKTNVDSLPEGFFDDPVLDAKARNVEYKDPMEDEWEKFQKTIAEENHVSEAIMEEDVEESLVERDIDQIDQQIYNWSIVKKLQFKVDEVHLAQGHNKNDKSSESETEAEEEYEDLLNNWRAKSTWKR